MTRTEKWLNRWCAKPKFVYDNCYSRLDQPLQARTFRIHQKHDVHPDPLWKFYMPYDAHEREQLLQMRHARNLVIKDQLQKGNNVQFRCSGLSMYPAVQEGGYCVFEPVLCLSKLQIGDIVFCQIEPEETFCAHTISGLSKPSAASAQYGDDDGEWVNFSISTQHGKQVGNCYRYQIYGSLVKV